MKEQRMLRNKIGKRKKHKEIKIESRQRNQSMKTKDGEKCWKVWSKRNVKEDGVNATDKTKWKNFHIKKRKRKKETKQKTNEESRKGK